MKAQWATLENEFRAIIINSLSKPDAFGKDISQHIST